jgi:ferric-dicitrate binding protein FerR (iron transport regulator)
MDEKKLNEFLNRFARGEYTEQEHQEFLTWLQAQSSPEIERIMGKAGALLQEQPDQPHEQQDDITERIEARLDESEKKFERGRIVSLITAIAASVVISLCAWLFWRNQPSRNNNSAVRYVAKIVPGKNQAYLTFANGSNLVITNAPTGVLATVGNIRVIKLKDGEVALKHIPGNPLPGATTITIPRGGQYKIGLTDGTQVWLNAASVLTIPAGFNNKERDVQLTGEGYFEVAKNKRKPFKVQARNSVVQVYGTHFDVFAYPDEATVKTTLLEGSVKISKGALHKMLVPGEQATVRDHIQLSKVDTKAIVEWKNGNFNFSHENIRSIMRKISRWYNVDVDYLRQTTDEGFVGTIPRSADIQNVLDMLQLTRTVHFKIKERRIIVMK